MTELTHLDAAGHARMVDVGGKAVTQREAVAGAAVVMRPETLALIESGGHSKGDVFAVARIAGIQAAKRCADLIPLCHPLSLDHVAVDFETLEDRIHITAEAATRGPTGVEMEALTAASVAGLTLYDMLKALSHDMVLEDVRLVEKTGGKRDKHA